MTSLDSGGEARASGPRGELAELARALRLELARRAQKGLRERAPERAAPPRSGALAAAAAPRAPRAETAARATRPEVASGAALPAPEIAAAPPPARGAAHSGARELAQRAAQCATLEELRAAVAGCTACALCETRTQTVFSDGDGRARVVFVGEAPGFHEDREGVPFVGPAGELLSDIVTKGMGLAREQVYIANVLKCRPPENRDPTEAEKELCTGWLDRQLELVGARVVVALGRHAAMHLLGIESSMARMRGTVHERAGRKIVATYHPAFLLRSPHMKKECWQDIQLAMRELGLPPRDAPARGGAAQRSPAEP